jgi:2-keto-4-pentenoate hydratase/2-oxohepta-3-ene-1,7-dioic acid hydratase in catechol pathway
MRWATYRAGAGSADRVGLVVDDELRALEPGTRLVDLLGDDGSRLAEAGERAQKSPADVHAIADVQLRSPIPVPPTIRDFTSFEEHIRNGLKAIGQELGDDWYEAPAFYFTNPNVMRGSGDPVRVPGNTERQDYELELGAIIGQAGSDLDPREAEGHIAGYCIFNDWSARDIQRKETATVPIGPAKGKDFANSLGPYLVTPDELADRRKDKGFDLAMSASVNGKHLSSGNWADIYWSFGEMVSYASRSSLVLPGDVFGSGTCGSGCILELSALHGNEKYPWLQEGDEVVLEIERLGQLRNRVTFGSQPIPLR